MKKRIFSILCAGMMILGLAGCQSSSVSTPSDDVFKPQGGGAADQPAVTTTATEQSSTSSEADETVEVTPTTTTVTSQAQPPEVTRTEVSVTEPTEPDLSEGETMEIDETFEIPENPELTENDIMLEIAEGTELTSDTDRLTLNVSYVGGEENAEYCFGCAYTLKVWSDEAGDWRIVPFGENSAFNALGYIVGSKSPKNAITVSLEDSFYAEPLKAGTYLVELPIDGITFSTTFVYKTVDNDSGYVIESEQGVLTLTIDSIEPDKFVCRLPWPYPAVYEVICDTSEYTDLCVNDNIEVQYAPLYKVEEFLFRVTPTDITFSDFELDPDVAYKPVIYLYPEQPTDISVRLDYNGTLTVTEPCYGNGWNVTAQPDGTITTADGSCYPYLFWEGENNFSYDITEGFCVSGADTEQFLLEKLSYLGLSDSEIAEFTEFWLPHMEKNAYNVITFRGADYTDNAKLDITPTPDTVIRVFMTYAPSDTSVQLPAQQLEAAPERSGFTVVEWGGAVIAR